MAACVLSMQRKSSGNLQVLELTSVLTSDAQTNLLVKKWYILGQVCGIVTENNFACRNKPSILSCHDPQKTRQWTVFFRQAMFCYGSIWTLSGTSVLLSINYLIDAKFIVAFNIEWFFINHTVQFLFHSVLWVTKVRVKLLIWIEEMTIQWKAINNLISALNRV